jgi:arsenate reductase
MKGILFLCTRNSCRSQMAEAFARRFGPSDLHVHSAGMRPTELDERAVRAMAEVGFDCAGQRPKGLDEVPLDEVDTVITLSPEMREFCPVFPRGVRVLHWEFEDPSVADDRPERLRAAYRNVREQIRARLERFLACEMAEA